MDASTLSDGELTSLVSSQNKKTFWLTTFVFQAITGNTIYLFVLLMFTCMVMSLNFG